MKKRKSLISFTLLSAGLQAAPVPSLPMLVTEMEQPLNTMELEGLAIADRWKSGTDKPIQSDDGAVIYFYGSSQPTVVCAPLKLCDIQLEPGEQITKGGLNAGDTVRWGFTPTLSGSGSDAVTHVLVKPKQIGIDTTLQISTNRRSYSIKLISKANDWMPIVKFDYPEQLNLALNSMYQRQQTVKASTTLGNGLNINNLDFEYRIEGKTAFAPIRVYNNSIKTILEMPRSVQTGKLPSLLVVNGGQRELINYRYRDGKFIVDGLPDQIALILGAGKRQQTVLIKRKGA
ncbi:P-type conjugative transfer protein TrbG [Vibrio sp. L85]|uniref:P-type conjugative transfer protein TrbG n=1 Tax=Vibrio sp. L85 TaxID=1769292 RepID=UPI001CBADA43|nr:P-type conjugative transfer protein TrbG [Vibrio sp. L85]